MPAPASAGLPRCTLSLAGVEETARVAQWRQWMAHMVDIDVPRRGGPFHGNLIAYTTDGVVLSHCESTAMTVRRSLDRIAHDDIDYYMIQIVLSGGAGRVTSGRSEVPSGPGDIMLMDFDRPIAIERAAYRAIGLFVPKRMLAPHLSANGEHCCIAHREHAMAATATDWALALLRQTPFLNEAGANLALSSLLPLLAASLAPDARAEGGATGRGGARQRHVLDYIHAHRDDPELDIAQVQAHFGISRSQLYRLFAGDPDGPAALIRHYRLKTALQDVVQRDDLSIAQIAYAAGFATPAGFSTAFRRMYHASPLQLRQQAQAPTGRRRPAPAARPYQPHLPSAG
ncbi:Transcriptional activator FeaR [Pigmentiphaga humi]|uniref:Transcriptional activator FeaR n=1 Tax=Pigmentiphaga humi TaxID=2478468 RepID=A0A3P4AX29_9BURK|nr:helix-turn-helix domain-containing protein [Pigmentiphaga humi]VCU68609.1 Transcriptional activator FeaR [Pigmentiphaga humi]